MILAFAFTAALCLKMFALSGGLSVEGETRGYAVMAVQNAAETLKLSGGSYEQLMQELGGELAESGWFAAYDAQGRVSGAKQAAFTVKALPVQSGHDLLGSADVTAHDKEGDVRFHVNVCWQEDHDG